MSGCEGQDNCTVELASLPLLAGCPADEEWFLVGNATGGQGTGKYARRLWSDLKNCISGIVLPPLIGIVNGGSGDDPVSGTSTFQSNKLIGLGATNDSKIQIVIDDLLQANFGTNINFSFDGTTGEIDISPNIWITGASLYIDLNQ